jgi:hypothetical protein
MTFKKIGFYVLTTFLLLCFITSIGGTIYFGFLLEESDFMDALEGLSATLIFGYFLKKLWATKN